VAAPAPTVQAAQPTVAVVTGETVSTVKACKFGAKCRAVSCRFAHPAPLQPVETTPAEQGGEGGGGGRASIKPCKFGAACRTVKCKFAHPAVQVCASSGADEAVHPCLVHDNAGAGAGRGGGRGGGSSGRGGEGGRGAKANGRPAPPVRPDFRDSQMSQPVFRKLEEIERGLFHGMGGATSGN